MFCGIVVKLISYLALSIEKCKVISFSKSRVPLIESCHINQSSLIPVHDMNNLGMILVSTLTYNKHLLHKVRKSPMI